MRLGGGGGGRKKRTERKGRSIEVRGKGRTEKEKK